MKKKISMFLAVMTLLTLIVSPLMYVRAADDEDDEVPAPDVTHAKAAALYNVRTTISCTRRTRRSRCIRRRP